MATGTSVAAGPVSSFDLEENQKRWVVIGICLNRVLLPVLRDFVAQEMPKHYTSLKSTSRIDTQLFGSQLEKDGPIQLNYGSINNNQGKFKNKVRSYDYNVGTAEDLAKLYLEPYMAKFTGFDNKCDLSAVLGILERASVFIAGAISSHAKDVRTKVRNEWGHCNFDHWTDPEFQHSFALLENVLLSLKLPIADETKVLNDLGDWKNRGVDLCVGCPVDKDLLKLVNDEVVNLQHDLNEIAKTGIDEVQKIRDALQNFRDSIETRITQLENRIDAQHKEQLQKNQELTSAIDDLSSNFNQVSTRQDESEVSIARLERDQKDLEESVTSKVDVLERKSADTDSKVKELESSLKDHVNVAPDDTAAFLAPRRNYWFCGRENELNAILGILKDNQSSCVDTAIYGLGGIGKTSLAVEFIWRNKSEYPGGIFWISGESNITFQSSVREMALEMNITSLENDFSFTLMKALAWLKRQSKMWCLVVDNLDELEMSEDMRKLLRGKWKQGSHGHVLITTRREPREILKVTGIEETFCIELKRLTQEQSVEFLRKKTGKIEGEDSKILELASDLSGLPLALDQAAAYIRYLSCSISDYVEQYRKQIEKVELLKKMKAQEPDEYTSPDRLAVHTTWLMNFEHITNSKSYDRDIRVIATLIMEVFAFLGPDDIPSEVFNDGLPQVDSPSLLNVISNPLRRMEVMSLLTNLSLFQQFGTNSYCVHRLVQEVIRIWMDEKRKEDAFCKEFFTKAFALIAGTRFLHYAFSNTRSPVKVCKAFSENAVFSVDNPPSLYLWGKLASHATYLLDHMLKFTTENEKYASSLLHTEETVRLLNEIAISYSVAREKVKAQEIQKLKLEFLTLLKQSPSDQPLNILLYFNMPLKDKYYKLISHCMRERLTNPEDSSNTPELNAADQLRQEGNQAVQGEEYKKALGLYNKAIELNSKDYRLYSNRALCYLKLGRPQESLNDCEECLSLKPCYVKALFRKAWALHELIKGGRCQDQLKGNAVATAALAHHLDSNAFNRELIIEKFPHLNYEEIHSDYQLEWALPRNFLQPNKTLLLAEGAYNVSCFVVLCNTQVVGLGSGAVLNCRQLFVVQNSKCLFQNVRFPKGNPPLICKGQTAVLHMNRCEVSAGFSRCQDFPECNGDSGCIAASRGKPRCDRTNKFGVPEPSGFAGHPGIIAVEGSTVYVERCQVHGCGGGGALVSDKGSRLFVQKCEVYNNQNGLEARNGGQLVATENKIYGNSTHGFLLAPDTGNCLIRNNKIFENQKEGVAVRYCKQETLMTVDSNYIHHNMAFGLSLQDCHLLITNNKIFENGFWGILCQSRTSANIVENDIFSNKCGGIFIGINFSGKVSITSNVVRDHAGPWLHCIEGPFPDETFDSPDPDLCFPPGEVKFHSYPPTQENNKLFNNIEGLFHPQKAIERLQSRYCYCSSKLCQKSLKRCPECFIAVYCGVTCQYKHCSQHKSLCAVLKRRYSTTVVLRKSEMALQCRIFGPHLKGIGKCLPPERNSRRAFIVKVQTGPLNHHPKQLMRVYDQSLSVDHDIFSSDVFNMIMECGVLGQFNKFTSKKAFFWATFADGGKKLNIFLSHLAPYQEW